MDKELQPIVIDKDAFSIVQIKSNGTVRLYSKNGNFEKVFNIYDVICYVVDIYKDNSECYELHINGGCIISVVLEQGHNAGIFESYLEQIIGRRGEQNNE